MLCRFEIEENENKNISNSLYFVKFQAKEPVLPNSMWSNQNNITILLLSHQPCRKLNK